MTTRFRTKAKPVASVTAAGYVISTAAATTAIRVQWPAAPDAGSPVASYVLYRDSAYLATIQRPSGVYPTYTYLDTSATTVASHSYSVAVVTTSGAVSVERGSNAAQRPTAPYWLPSAPTTLTLSAGATYLFASYAASYDAGDTLTYSLVTNPGGYSINASTGLLTVGTVAGPVTIQVTDQTGLYANTTCTVTVQTASTDTYVATHYVAPISSGLTQGSTDYGVSGRPFAQATSPLTPCTLGTAMAAAQAGNKVQVAPGIYSGVDYGDRWVGSFMNFYSGTAGNPIVFFAQHPAATNYGNTALYSELRRPVGDYTVDCSPVLQVRDGTSYIVYDGFYANENHVVPGAVSGMFGMHAATGCEYRRIAADRRVFEYPTGGNYAIMFLQTTTDCRIVDCYFSGNVGFNNWNDANFEIYGCVNLIFEYCTWASARYPMYLKARIYSPADPDEQTPTVRYCKFLNCFNGPVHKDHGLMPFHNNLIVAQDTGLYENTNDLTALALTNAYNNTIVMTGTAAPTTGPGGIRIANATYDGSTYRNNIVYIRAGVSSAIPLVARAASAYTTLDEFTMEANHYYDAGGTPTWVNAGSTYASLANWRSATGKDLTATEGDPLFVNASGGDYRLQAGSPALAGVGGRTTTAGCYITGAEEIGVRSNPSY